MTACIMSRVPVPAAHLALGEPRGHPAHAADPVGAGCVQPLHLRPQALRAAVHLHQPDVCSSTLVSFVVVVVAVVVVIIPRLRKNK